MQIIFKYSYFLLMIMAFGCSKQKASSQTNTNPNPTPTPTFVFVKGADISWVTQMESSGYKFYDSTGAQKDCFTLLKSLGMNSIRLRVWVNPSDGWCNTTDLVAKA